jgi:general secretion pathway protein J
MEVLVAVAILAMVVASVWSSFDATMKGMKATEDIQEHYSGVRNAMDRMAGDLATAYLSFNRPADETRHFTYFEGRNDFGNDSISFATFGHLRMRRDADESDQAIVQYYVAGDPNDATRKHLWRREDRRLHGDRPEQLYQYAPAYILLEDVDSLEVRFFDPQRDDWSEEWSTMRSDAQPDRLPTRVEIKLGIKNNRQEVEYFTTQVPMIMLEKIDLGRGG